MYEINQSIINAIEIPSSLHVESKIIIQPSTIFMSGFDDSHPAEGLTESAGVLRTPLAQEIAYVSLGDKLCTFYTDNNELKYMLEGSSNVITISSVSPIGKVGVFGNSLFLVNTSNELKKYTITWASILSESTTPLDAGTTVDTLAVSTDYSSCAVSETEVVVFYYDDGGFRAVYYSGATEYLNDDRFMFPVYADSDRVSSRTPEGMIIFTTAAKLNGDVFAYISNPLIGSVDGIKFSNTTKTWSDIFVAVPTDLDVTQYETMVANSYVRDNQIYMSVQLHQIELTEEESVISFIISSKDGKNFTYNRYTSVTDLGYRFLATIHGSTVQISSCNRTAEAEATYIFSPISGSDGYSYDITDKLLDITDGSQESAYMSFGDSDFSMSRHVAMKEGNRLLWRISYLTTNGTEYIDYAKFIIENISVVVSDGERKLRLSLTNESLYNLQSSNAPYYTEVISKSSIYADFSDLGDFDTSGSGGLAETSFAVDYWNSEGYDGFGATPVTLNSRGGLDLFEYADAHVAGIKAGDLKIQLGSSAYPLVTSSPVHIKIYGWSHDDRVSGSSNDIVTVACLMQDELGEEYTSGSDGGYQFPNTYPDSASGDYPIEFDMALTEGDRIKDICLIFSCANATEFYISRVEITSGVLVNYPYKTNSIWELENEKYKLPFDRKAFIMFAQKPYDAHDFIITGSFEHDVTGYLSTHNVGFGLVGLGMDSANYIVGRYNISTDKFQIVNVRGSLETLLVEGSPTTTVGNNCELQFQYRGGHFSLRMRVDEDWVEQINYDWQESDGYMILDLLTSNKVGIYGQKDAPFFRITGYEPGSTESGSTAVAIPVLPGYNTYSDFPTEGKVKIGDTIYNYTGKMAVTDIRGPFQFRQCGDGTQGQYVAPYGINEPGIECRDMDWTRDHTIDIGRLCAIDDGSVFVITETKWDVWITTGGAVVELPGRARYYGPLEIAPIPRTLYNRVYMTYGLTGASLYKGEVDWHVLGDEAVYYFPGNIYCTAFSGSSGNEDATIKDVIQTISDTSGAIAEFGDIFNESLTTVSGSDALGSQEYISGFDILFEMNDAEFGTSDYIDVYSETSILVNNANSLVRFTWIDSSATFSVELFAEPDHTLMDRKYFVTGNQYHNFRVLYHDNFITIYVDGRWIYTFCLPDITYPVTCNYYLLVNSDLTFDNVYVTELSDWSEAFYIDLDTDGKSAISQVIKERPVEIIYRSNGAIKYSYNEVRDEVSLANNWIKGFTEDRQMPNNCGSNAIIYSDIVRTLQYLPYLREYGFATKIFRLPNLTIGSLKAAKLLLKKGMESSKKYSLSYRPDPQVEIGDKVITNVDVLGTGLTIEKEIIIEQLSMSLKNGRFGMKLSGRGSL